MKLHASPLAQSEQSANASTTQDGLGGVGMQQDSCLLQSHSRAIWKARCSEVPSFSLFATPDADAWKVFERVGRFLFACKAVL
jgi:hypothetical protein